MILGKLRMDPFLKLQGKSRGGSMTAATSKVELLAIIVNGFQHLDQKQNHTKWCGGR